MPLLELLENWGNLALLELLVVLELLATYQISPCACIHRQAKIIVNTSISKKLRKL